MTDPCVEIRNATTKDIEGLVRLLGQLFAIEKDFDFNPEKHKNGLAIMLDGCGKHRTIKVALKGQAIVGMCTAQTRISTAKGSICAVLEDLVVDRQYRGQGIGRALLQHIESWARKRGIADLQLLADRENTPALGFYSAQKWNPTQLVCLTRRLK